MKFYNDSKGTNVDASIIALKALERDIVLIAGGDGKAQDFTELGENLLPKLSHLLGERNATDERLPRRLF